MRSPNTVLRMAFSLGTLLIGGGADMADGQSPAYDKANAIVPGTATVSQAIRDSLGLDGFSLVQLDLPVEHRATFDFQIAIDGADLTVHLEPYSVRAPDFRVLVDHGDGQLEEIPAPARKTLRGYVDGVPNSVVVGSLKEDSFSGMLFMDDGETRRRWVVEPLKEVIVGASNSEHIVYRVEDSVRGDWRCGTPLLNPEHLEATDRGSSNARRSAGFRLAEIAYDADFEFYLLNNSSVEDTVFDVEIIHSVVKIDYERDVDIGLGISAIIVRTAEPDPYTSSDPITLLDQVRNEWEGQQGIKRDITHLMTGRNLDGNVIGIAWQPAVCTSFGYGLSQSRYSLNLFDRAALTVHEIGHNFNAAHCDGAAQCNVMCSTTGQCGGYGLPSFAPVSINAINSYVASLNPFCVQGAPFEKIYWTDVTDNEIERSNLDGSQQETLYSAADGLQGLGGITLDTSAGMMYWTEVVNIPNGTPQDPPAFAAIRRASMNGTGLVEDLVTFDPGDPWGGILVPSDIAVDPLGGKIYWTDFHVMANRIQRANLDGSNVETVVQYPTGSTSFVSPSGIVLDPVGGKMYWALFHLDAIFSASLDGTGQTLLWQPPNCGPLCGPLGLALDALNGQLYWTRWPANSPGGGDILRANVDGSGSIETLYSYPRVGGLVGIDVDSMGRRMYYAEPRRGQPPSPSNFFRPGIRWALVDDLTTPPVTIRSNLDVTGPVGIALDLTPRFGPDCNGNGVPDSSDISVSISQDVDGNGIPDECEPVPVCPSTGNFGTKTYEIAGAANDTAWSWCIRSTDASFDDVCELNVPGIPVGETALDVAQAFVDSINARRVTLGCTMDQLTAVARNLFGTVTMSIRTGNGGAFELWVGPANADPGCEVIPLQLPVCGFNPTIDDLGLDPADCNGNGWSDWIDIFITGDSVDTDNNGIPDECECGTGPVNIVDHAGFSACLLGPAGGLDPGCDCFDLDGDGSVTLLDFADFQLRYTPG